MLEYTKNQSTAILFTEALLLYGMRYFDSHTHHRKGTVNAIVQGFDQNFPTLHSVGFHPCSQENPDYQWLEKALNHPKCLALGEVGLDRLKGPNLEVQHIILSEQLNLANNLKKPVIFHIVRAWEEFYALQKKKQETPWILHGFNQPKQFQRLLDTPVNLSIGPAALANSSMHPILVQIPLERLLFETDDSNTTIESVYLQFCHITGHRIEPLCQQIEQNFIAIFGT